MERIILKNISKTFKMGARKNQSILERILNCIYKRNFSKTIEVLKDFSLTVRAGEMVGITGPNGIGKSTLLRIIAGIYKQDKGAITVKGKIVSLINLYAGLKERLTMKENIYLVGSLLGMTIKEIDEQFDSIINFSGLENFVDNKIYQFSNGMLQRLAFSLAIHAKPDILLLDEVFEVGDEEFRKKSVNWIKDFVKNGGCVLLVSHDKELLKENCTKIIVLNENKQKS